MDSIKKYPINELLKKIMGKNVFFKSDCQFFAKEGIKGRVIDVTFSNSIPLFTVKIKDGREIHVDGGMKNLQFEVIS